MKLRLSTSLRLALMAVFGAATLPVTQAAIMHSQISLITYTDFGQNRGRYVVGGNVNALLSHIREVEGGVRIHYLDGREPYTMQHDMVDFGAQCDGGFSAIIGYNFDATVHHNAINNNTYTGKYIGASNAIRYKAIELADGTNFSNVFAFYPINDYRLTRQSKVATDVYGTPVYGQDTREDWDNVRGNLTGALIYRSGGGNMQVKDLDGSVTGLAGAYTYVTGGISSITSLSLFRSDGGFTLFYPFSPGSSSISDSAPMPDKPIKGDSGSPVYIWNDKTQRYEYLAAYQSLPDNGSNSTANLKWTVDRMEGFNKVIDSDSSTFTISGLSITGDTITDKLGYSATIRKGLVTDAAGNQTEYIGCDNTWSDLSDVKDKANWYAYGNEYLAASVEDLFFTENLVFAANKAQNTITLNDTIDLGVGYMQLSKAAGMDKASFTVVSAEGADHTLHSAGYVVDAGVELHLQIADKAQMSEWRKVGEGDLYIEGQGDTNILLNVGGNGKTHLNREDGYAAYNVLVNSGSTVVIHDTGQIKRDLTFGYRGGVLDMNGNSMVWNNDNGTDADGFTIHALDEQAVIANHKAGATSTVTWRQSGMQKWLGSFQDTADSALRFVYDGGGVLTMNSIHTALQHADSGMDVASGKVVLVGANTVHGYGSLNGFTSACYTSAQDWHYADAAMSVSIASGATFELGSHARLSGDITVAEGGAFIMREGTQHRYEYIEGGQMKEDTQAIADYFGLKGNITNNGAMVVEYSAGTDSRNVYAGDIGGSGSISLALGQGAKLEIGGTVDLAGAKTLASGMLILSHDQVGGGEKWQVADQAVLAFTRADSAAALAMVAETSSGVLAIGKDTAQKLDMSGHGNLYLGAAEGCTTNYGTLGTTEALDAWHTEGSSRTQWLLGGGEGNLVVHWQLTGDSDLVLGNAYGAGTVTLTNIANDFTGDIIFTPGSNVVLDYTDVRALGNAKLDLGYGMALSGGAEVNAMVNSEVIGAQAAGIVLLDREAGATIDMSARPSLALGVGSGELAFSGSVSVAKDQAYRFSGPGRLVLQNALAANGANDLIVDAQGFTGGSVSLAAASDISGEVLVEGYDDSRSSIRSGSISLVLGADHALDKTTLVTAQHGGALVAADGTVHHLKALALNNGGTLELLGAAAVEVDELTIASGAALYHDDSDRAALTAGAGAIAGEVAVATIHKTGSGDLELGNDTWGGIAFNTLEVHAGSVSLSKDLVGSGGTIVLDKDTSVKLNGHTLNNAVSARGNATLSANNGTLIQNIDVAEGAVLTVTGSAVTLSNGEVDKDNGVMTLQAMQLAAAGGTVDFSAVGTLTVDAWQDNATTLIGSGTVRLPQNLSIYAKYGFTAALGFDCLENRGNTATITQQGPANANVKLDIGALNGGGGLTWKSTSNYGQASVMTLGQAGSFDGTLTVQHSATSASNGSYQTYLQLDHAEAAAQATVNLQGGKGYVSMALNADTVKLGGLQGNPTSLVFAGSAPTSASEAPASTRNTVLEITGGGTNSFAGSIVGNADKGVSLLMSGAGTQTFTGESIVLRDVTVQGGTLHFTKSPTVYGNYAIAQGAALEMDGGLTLGSGQTLAATAGTAGQSASLKGNLVLSGGSLTFSGNALNALTDGTYLLGVSGVSSTQDSLDIHIAESTVLTMDRTYNLVGGDFSSLDKVSYNFTHDYFKAQFTVNRSGLSMSLTAKDGSMIWNGTDANDKWDKDAFGQYTNVDYSGKRLVFTDMAEKQDVTVNHTMSVGQVVVDTEDGYSFGQDAAQCRVTATRLDKLGSGDLVLTGGLTVSGTTNLEAGAIVMNGNYIGGAINGENGTLALDNAGDVGIYAIGTIGELEVRSGTSLTMFEDDASPAYCLTVAGQVHVQSGGTIRLEGGLDVASKVSLEGGTLSLDDPTYPGNSLPGQVRSAISVQADSTIAVAQAQGRLTINKVVSADGTTLTKNGAGLLIFAGNSFDIRHLNVAEGDIQFSGSNKWVTGVDAITLREKSGLTVNSGMSLYTELTLEKNNTITLEQDDNLTTRLSATATMGGDVTVAFKRYNSGSTIVSGSISGTGTLTLAQTSGSTSQVTFAASLNDGGEGETTALRVKGGTAVALSGVSTFSGGTVIESNASVTVANALALGRGVVELASGGTLTLTSDALVGHGITGSGSITSDASARKLAVVTVEGETQTFGGTLTGDTLSLLVSGAGTQALTGTAQVAGVTAQGGRLELSGSGKVVTGAITMTAADTQVGGTLQNVAVTANGISGTGGAQGSLQALAISLAAGETTLTNVTIASGTTFSGATPTRFTGTPEYSVLVLDGTVLQLEADVNATVLEKTDTLCRIQCTAFNNVILNGDLVLDFSSILDAGDSGSVALTFGDTVALADELKLRGLWNGYTLQGNLSDGGTLTFALIPEPATATLSLLALAALAARRRRIYRG